MKINCEAYWNTIELDSLQNSSDKIQKSDHQKDSQFTIERKDALNRAHEIRKFEIELYWRRASHFWVLQAAVFAAIGLVWNSAESVTASPIPFALAALGVLTARAGYLSAKGSKFWQENWEFHIDMLENEFEGRLHKTVYVGSDGISYSVSGINQQLAYYFYLFWIFVIFYLFMNIIQFESFWESVKLWELQRVIPEFQSQGNILINIIISLVAIIGVLLLNFQTSSFKNSMGVSLIDGKQFKLKNEEPIFLRILRRLRFLPKTESPYLIRRSPKLN